MGRPKKEQTEKIVSTSVRLPESKHETLKEYSKNNYRSISEQIEMIIDEFFANKHISKTEHDYLNDGPAYNYNDRLMRDQ